MKTKKLKSTEKESRKSINKKNMVKNTVSEVEYWGQYLSKLKAMNYTTETFRNLSDSMKKDINLHISSEYQFDDPKIPSKIFKKFTL